VLIVGAVAGPEGAVRLDEPHHALRVTIRGGRRLVVDRSRGERRVVHLRRAANDAQRVGVEALIALAQDSDTRDNGVRTPKR
jgi:hypothetical protein